MSDKRFKVPAPPPMYAIRSCIADKAKTIDEARFLELESTVKVMTDSLNDVSEELETLQQKVTAEYNKMVELFNTAAKYINTFNTVIDSMATILFPTGSIVYSSLKPSEYIMYDSENGVWGNLPGNWGWSEEPITTIEFTWNDPVDPGTIEEPDTTTWTTTDDETTTVGGNKVHKVKIPIYAYYCQAEESTDDLTNIEELPTLETLT